MSSLTAQGCSGKGKERLDDPRRQLALEAAIDRYVPDMDATLRHAQQAEAEANAPRLAVPFYSFVEKGLEGAPMEEQQMAFAWGAMLMLDYLSLGTMGMATGPLRVLEETAAEKAISVPGEVGRWSTRFPGVQVRRIGNYWVKRENPSSPAFMQKWGRMTIRQQAAGLERLRAAGSPAANSRLFPSGRLVVEDVGKPLGYGSYFKPKYWSARLRDSKALGSVLNDLRPGNYGNGYRPFDPVIDPIQKSMAIGGATGVTWGTYKLLKED